MRPLSELKLDLEVSSSLGEIIDVLKIAALIQFRGFQAKQKPYEEFLHAADSTIRLIAAKRVESIFFQDNKDLASVIIAVTSDEGFLGELNTLLVNTAIDQRVGPQDILIVLGERGARYAEDMNLACRNVPQISDDVKFAEIEMLRDSLMVGYGKNYGRVLIVYPRFVSLTMQKVSVEKLIPYSLPPEGQDRLEIAGIADECALEPTVDEAVRALMRAWLGFKMFDIAWSSKLSEFAARIMHLEGSTQELTHLKRDLSLEYFKKIHAIRDKVIREISASKILIGKRIRSAA